MLDVFLEYTSAYFFPIPVELKFWELKNETFFTNKNIPKKIDSRKNTLYEASFILNMAEN
jgi:hypothetical protein